MTVIDYDTLFPTPDPPITDLESDDRALVMFGELGACRKFWLMVWLMAARDHATEIGYLPGAGRDILTYTVENTRYEMVPPPDEYAPDLIAAARRLVRPGRWAAARWRLAGLFGDRACAAVVALNISGNAVHWAVTVWQAGGRRGVHFRRLDAVRPPDPWPATPPA